MSEHSICIQLVEDSSRPAAPPAGDRGVRAGPLPEAKTAPSTPTVLIVEFRDEVYAALETMLREENIVPARAACETTVGAQINRLAPGLVLIYDRMPYETGWLIACKLAFSHPEQPVWLYGAWQPDRLAQRQLVCGVERFISYEGILPRLAERLRQAVRVWRGVQKRPVASDAGAVPDGCEVRVGDHQELVLDFFHKEVCDEKDAVLDRIVGPGFGDCRGLPIRQQCA